MSSGPRLVVTDEKKIKKSSRLICDGLSSCCSKCPLDVVRCLHPFSFSFTSSSSSSPSSSSFSFPTPPFSLPPPPSPPFYQSLPSRWIDTPNRMFGLPVLAVRLPPGYQRDQNNAQGTGQEVKPPVEEQWISEETNNSLDENKHSMSFFNRQPPLRPCCGVWLDNQTLQRIQHEVLSTYEINKNSYTTTRTTTTGESEPDSLHFSSPTTTTLSSPSPLSTARSTFSTTTTTKGGGALPTCTTTHLQYASNALLCSSPIWEGTRHRFMTSLAEPWVRLLLRTIDVELLPLVKMWAEFDKAWILIIQSEENLQHLQIIQNYQQYAQNLLTMPLMDQNESVVSKSKSHYYPSSYRTSSSSSSSSSSPIAQEAMEEERKLKRKNNKNSFIKTLLPDLQIMHDQTDQQQNTSANKQIKQDDHHQEEQPSCHSGYYQERNPTTGTNGHTRLPPVVNRLLFTTFPCTVIVTRSSMAQNALGNGEMQICHMEETKKHDPTKKHDLPPQHLVVGDDERESDDNTDMEQEQGDEDIIYYEFSDKYSMLFSDWDALMQSTKRKLERIEQVKQILGTVCQELSSGRVSQMIDFQMRHARSTRMYRDAMEKLNQLPCESSQGENDGTPGSTVEINAIDGEPRKDEQKQVNQITTRDDANRVSPTESTNDLQPTPTAPKEMESCKKYITEKHVSDLYSINISLMGFNLIVSEMKLILTKISYNFFIKAISMCLDYRRSDSRKYVKFEDGDVMVEPAPDKSSDLRGILRKNKNGSLIRGLSAGTPNSPARRIETKLAALVTAANQLKEKVLELQRVCKQQRKNFQKFLGFCLHRFTDFRLQGKKIRRINPANPRRQNFRFVEAGEVIASVLYRIEGFSKVEIPRCGPSYPLTSFQTFFSKPALLSKSGVLGELEAGLSGSSEKGRASEGKAKLIGFSNETNKQEEMKKWRTEELEQPSSVCLYEHLLFLENFLNCLSESHWFSCPLLLGGVYRTLQDVMAPKP